MTTYRPSLEPKIVDRAPSDEELTAYDREHLVTYLRLLDAETAGATWQEVATVVLRHDPMREHERARVAWESHLARARWLSSNGYLDLLS